VLWIKSLSDLNDVAKCFWDHHFGYEKENGNGIEGKNGRIYERDKSKKLVVNETQLEFVIL